MTVLAYFDALAVAAELSRRLNTSERGICGSSDGHWERDILETMNMTSSNDTAIGFSLATSSQTSHDHYIDNIMRVRDTRMITGYAVEYRTGGGYMLSLGTYYLSLILDFTYPVLSEVSIEFWVKLSVPKTVGTAGTIIKGKRVLCSVIQREGSLTVWYIDELVINWGSYEIKTGLVLKNSLWVHFSVTWRNSDGRLVIMLANADGETGKSVHYGIFANQLFYIDKGFFIGHDEKNELLNIELVLELDEFHVWQFARKDEDIVLNMAVKTQGYIDGLLMFCGFDEGYGMAANGTLYAIGDNATASGYYHRGNKTQDKRIVFEVKPQNANLIWKPSGAPYPNSDNYEINFESNDLQNEAINECHKLFYTGNLYKFCGKKLVTQTLFYYEACLMDVAHSGNIKHTKISVSMFAFYCQKVLMVRSCDLHGFYDGFLACENEPGLDVIVIISICIGGFVFMMVMVCCIILLCLRRRRKKKSKESKRQDRKIGLKRVPSPDMYRDVRDDDDDDDDEHVGELGQSSGAPKYNKGLLEDSHEVDGRQKMEESSF